jgi:hypothetical protein
LVSIGKLCFIVSIKKIFKEKTKKKNLKPLKTKGKSQKKKNQQEEEKSKH